MSFDTEVVKPDRGRALRVDISLDSFATISYRYSDVPGTLDGTNQYSPRVLELGSVRRAFGQNRIPASSVSSLKLANADGAVDWICGRENIADAKRARFRVYVTLYDPAASPLVFVSKLLGEFVLSSWPTQDNAEVSLNLADDFMGRLGAGLLLPTLLDWSQVGTTSNNPIKNAIGIPQSITQSTPVQLAFGEDAMLALPYIIPVGNNAVGETYNQKLIVPLYSTTDTAAVDQNLIQRVIIEAFRVPPTLEDVEDPTPYLRPLPRTVYDNIAEVDLTVWSVEKSPTISKGGLSFQIVYLVVRTDLGNLSMRYVPVTNDEQRIGYESRKAQLQALARSNGYDAETVNSADENYGFFGSRLTKVYVYGTPKSQRTNAPTVNGFSQAHAVDVITDLVSVYSAATVDATSAARVKAGNPFTAATGVVQPWTERANNPSLPLPPFSLRQVLAELCQSSDFDIFLNWDGEIAFASDVFDFTTATQAGLIVEILETELHPGTARWVASDGERGAPFNRVSFEGGRADPTTYRDVPFQGPFDLAAADIPQSAGIIEVVLRQGWRPYRQQVLDPWVWRSLDGVTRDRVRFSMSRAGLRLELGEYFKLTWTRGTTLAGPYSGTIFQCEALTYSPDGDVVEVEGIWRDDTVTERQYLLDDETLLAYADLTITATATSDGAGRIDFATGTGIDIVNLAEGAIIILRDTTQAEDVFTRFGAWRITTVEPDAGGPYVLVAVNGEGNYPAAGAVASGQWHIEYGATDYASNYDAINYPSGGDMYGKATAADGTTSDTAVGNRLISG